MAEGPFPEAALTVLFAAMFAVLGWRDLRTQTISNSLVYPAIALALAASWVWSDRGLTEALVGCGVASIGAVVVRAASRGGLGGGDVKVATLAGAMVGYPGVLTVAALTAVAGGVTAACLLMVGRATRHTVIPYGPFVALGTIVSLVSR